MSFNPDISKQAQEAIFSKKTNKLSHPLVLFNNILMHCTSTKKHLSVYLDEKLYFRTHIREKKRKASKKTVVTKKLSKSLPRNSLLTICK